MMTGRMALLIRRLLAGAAALALVMALGACIIAQSSSDVPRLPETRPTIVSASVVPSTTNILTRWPDFFTIPVELSDPTVSFVYAAFVDYNPLTGAGLVPGSVGDNPYDQQSLATRVRTFEISIPQENVTNDRCHVIEVVVALRFSSLVDSKNVHTPAAPGGDSVSWIYNPSGDPSGCPRLDAGIEAGLVDGEGGL